MPDTPLANVDFDIAESPTELNITDSDQKKRAKQAFNAYQDGLNLPDNTVYEGQHILEQARENGLIDLHGYEVAVAAALYLACRKTETPRTTQEFTALVTKSKDTISNQARKFQSELNLSAPPYFPQSFVERYVTDLDLSEDTEQTALNIISTAQETGLSSGRAAHILAAGAIYTAAQLTDDNLSKSDVAEATNTSPLTISQSQQQLQSPTDS